MKSLTEYIREEFAGNGSGIAPSVGAQIAHSSYATPGNTMGMGDPKFPEPEEPGSGDIYGVTRHLSKTGKVKKEKKNDSKTKRVCTRCEEERD